MGVTVSKELAVSKHVQGIRNSRTEVKSGEYNHIITITAVCPELFTTAVCHVVIEGCNSRLGWMVVLMFRPPNPMLSPNC